MGTEIDSSWENRQLQEQLASETARADAAERENEKLVVENKALWEMVRIFMEHAARTDPAGAREFIYMLERNEKSSFPSDAPRRPENYNPVA